MTAGQPTKVIRSKPVGRFYELQQEVKVPEDYVLTSKIRIKPMTRKQAIAMRSAATDEDANRIFLGDQADAVFELYDDRPEQEWAAFVADLFQHFMGPGLDDAEGKSEESSS